MFERLEKVIQISSQSQPDRFVQQLVLLVSLSSECLVNLPNWVRLTGDKVFGKSFQNLKFACHLLHDYIQSGLTFFFAKRNFFLHYSYH